MFSKKTPLLLLILFLAVVLRLYNISLFPNGFDWDEASIGWNAYSLAMTGTDEYGYRLPVSIRSFNDYKPSFYVYATVPSVYFLGMNEFSTRLPSAVAGVLTVLLTYYLVIYLQKISRKDKSFALPLLSAFLIAISPWHLQFSRAAFESNLSLFFVVGGITLLIKYYYSSKTPILFLSLTSFIFSLYTYHSARVFAPFYFAVFVFSLLIKSIIGNVKLWFGTVIFVGFLLFPLVRNATRVGTLQARFNSVSIIDSSRKISDYPAIIATNYLKHFDPNFLFVTGDQNKRHNIAGMGLLYLIEMPFLISGFYYMFRNNQKWAMPILLWLLLAPIASSLAKDSPHALRSLIFLPTFQIVTAYGILSIFSKFRKYIFWLSIGVTFLYVVNTYYYLDSYYFQAPVEYAKSWQYGYRDMVKKVLSIESKYDRIYVTTEYDQPYIYFLFYGRISPVVKNNGYFAQGLDKYEFRDYSKISQNDVINMEKNSLVILTHEGDSKLFKTIDKTYFPDGSIAFVLSERI